MQKSQQQQCHLSYLQIFHEQKWPSFFSKKYLINSHAFYINEDETQFLINDCTNPDYSQFKPKEDIDDVIQNKLNGSAFLKIYGRTPKDISNVMNKILNTEELVMAIKMSQFLTEALDEQLEQQKQDIEKQIANKINLSFTLRQFKDYLEHPSKQFRLYMLNQNIVGICQKNPNHISTGPNQYQISKAKQLAGDVSNGIIKMLKQKNKQANIKIQIVVDCFLLQNGKKAKILSIDPIKPLHSLSLFSLEQLQKAFQECEKSILQNRQFQPIIKFVKSQNQYLQIDLSNYRVGAELVSKDALEQWKQFIKGK